MRVHDGSYRLRRRWVTTSGDGKPIHRAWRDGEVDVVSIHAGTDEASPSIDQWSDSAKEHGAVFKKSAKPGGGHKMDGRRRWASPRYSVRRRKTEFERRRD